VTSPARQLPAVHALLHHERLAQLTPLLGRDWLAAAAREAVGQARQAALSGAPVPTVDELAERAADLAASWLAPRPRPLLNATGIILHTNLGRAPVSAEAARAMRRVAAGYADLEYDLPAGGRGSRHDLVAPLLCRLAGAEAALVVNNNAAATLLILSALAAGGEVVVSRGQLVEIGGGYRLPAILAAGGARLVEVGTTNRTHARDYRAAIGPETALVLRVHASNYRIVGFTKEVPLAELVALAHEHDLPLVDDLGSGSLLDTTAFGLAAEPTVTGSLAAGADLACFSGDKLLGGPQAGLIVGRADLVDRLRASPLARAMRPDKVTLAGLHATLVHYARHEAERRVPVWRMIGAEPSALAGRAHAWRMAAAAWTDGARVVAGESAVGGGSLPGTTLPTSLLALESARPSALAAALRAAPTPVVARVAGDAVLLDPRTVLPEHDRALLASVRHALTC